MSKWNYKTLADLIEILANLYPQEADARRIAAKAGLKTAQIDFTGSSVSRWYHVVYNAEPRNKVDHIVAAALEENPEFDWLKHARLGTPPPVIKGPEDIRWSGLASTGEFEKLMGARSTLVPVVYLKIGTARAKWVVRVKRADGSSGTGFIVAGGTLITNNHVLSTPEIAKSAVVQFNYQHGEDGLSAPTTEAHLRDETFRTSIEDDWTAVTLEGDGMWTAGGLPLTRTPIGVGDYVNIIQHPGGGPKQVSLSANVVAYVGGGRVQYLTDTLPGSSGSPVFDVRWNVVALHHSGGWLTEPGTAFKNAYYRNEGIAIDRVIDGLAKT
jgi:V8-like Glu-specific endopeptidase